MSRQSIKNILLFSVGFILFTVVGTLSHELGHVAVARYFGYETTLHYGYMRYHSSPLSIELEDIWKARQEAIDAHQPFEQKAALEKGRAQLKNQGIWILWGGPLQTMLTGTLGFLYLVFKKKRPKGLSKFSFTDWLAVYLSLFWLREVFNLVTALATELIWPKGSYFGGDEKRISLHLDLWPGSIPILFGSIGLVLGCIVVFKFIPSSYQASFVLSGMLGGTLGFYLWLRLLGPILMP